MHVEIFQNTIEQDQRARFRSLGETSDRYFSRNESTLFYLCGATIFIETFFNFERINKRSNILFHNPRGTFFPGVKAQKQLLHFIHTTYYVRETSLQE